MALSWGGRSLALRRRYAECADEGVKADLRGSIAMMRVNDDVDHDFRYTESIPPSRNAWRAKPLRATLADALISKR